MVTVAMADKLSLVFHLELLSSGNLAFSLISITIILWKIKCQSHSYDKSTVMSERTMRRSPRYAFHQQSEVKGEDIQME